MLGATEMQFEALDSQNTGCHPRIFEQELLFFADFAIKTHFSWFHPRNREIRAFFEMKIFFLVFISEFVEIRDENLYFFGLHSRIRSIELFVPPSTKFVYALQPRHSGAGLGLHQNSIVFFEVSVSGLGLSEFGPTVPKKESRPSLPRRNTGCMN